MYRIIFSITMILISVSTVRGESMNEISAVKETSMNYMQAWYKGDAERIAGSLHTKLAKRSLKGLFGEPNLRHTTASDMIRYTKQGYGQSLWQENQKIEVIVLDIYKNIASVKITAPHYYEYLHLGKIDNKWVIVNALYESKSPMND